MKKPRTLPRRRKKRSAAAKVRPFWVPIAIAVALLAGVLGFAATWPGFDAADVGVSGNRIVPRAEILARAAIAPNANIWLQNTGAITKRIEQIPYIESAAVHRLPPASMSIAVRERAPFAVLLSGGEAVLVDRALRVLQPASGTETLPVLRVPAGLALEPGTFVSDRSAIELRDRYETLIAAHVVARSLSFDRFGGLVATMRDGVRILLGEDDNLGKKLALVDPILAQVVRNRRSIAAIDLRAPSTPVLVYK